MKIGFLTVCLGGLSLEEKAEWAKQQGFESLELACWPGRNDREYSGNDIDVDTMTEEKADEIKAFIRDLGLTVSSLAYYDNNIDADAEKRTHVNKHLKKVIDAATLLGVSRVGTFVGRNIDKSIKDNFDEYEEVFTDLVAYAEKKKVYLMIENCDMRGWQRPWEPGTISYSPELWEEMFRRIPSDYFGLNYDPSHLVYLMMDYLSPLYEFKDRIFHVHAKDARVKRAELNRYGVYDKRLGKENEWGLREAKIPGLGAVDWAVFVKTLKDIGYDHVISIEHEDEEFEGSQDKVKEGLRIGLQHLKSCM